MNRPIRAMVVDEVPQLGARQALYGAVGALLISALLLYVESSRLAGLLDTPVGTILLLPIALGLAGFVVLRDDRLWTVSAILSLVVFVVRTGEGSFGALEIFYGLYSLGGLLIWFAKELAFYRRPIVRSRYDFWLLSATLLCLLLGGLGFLLNGGDIRLGMREASACLTLLFYFPVRRTLKNRRDVLFVVGAVALLGLINGYVNVVNYQEKVIASALEYGAVNARSAMNEVLSSVLVCASFSIVLLGKTMKERLAGLVGLAGFSGLLVLSLSRGPILATGFGCVVALVLAAPGKIGRVSSYLLLAVVINLAAAWILFPEFVTSIGENISDRFAAIEQITGDKALGSRFLETQAIAQEFIPASPMIGYGFGVPYDYYDAAFGTSFTSYYTHNGYLSPLSKFGIPPGLFVLVILPLPLLRLPFWSTRQRPSGDRLIAAGAIAALVSIMVTNVTSNAVVYYTELTLIGIVLAIFDFLDSIGIDKIIKILSSLPRRPNITLNVIDFDHCLINRFPQLQLPIFQDNR